ncbi:hypothetical protein FACS1894199_04720 [Bacteroidia bacterium]|nr:hypothetical protein FACS1894199_04720 [Bacteroidia bacterium]
MLKNYMNGEWVASTGNVAIDVVNPAMGKVIEQVPAGTKADIDNATAAAQAVAKYVYKRGTENGKRVQAQGGAIEFH